VIDIKGNFLKQGWSAPEFQQLCWDNRGLEPFFAGKKAFVPYKIADVPSVLQ
jgi:hypothetical protein